MYNARNPDFISYKFLPKCTLQQTDDVMMTQYTMNVVGCFVDFVALTIFQPYRDLEAGDNHIATWKQEITNLWNRSDETGNRIPDLLLCNPRV